MKTWTAHTAPGLPPVLVFEGFSWAALLFGPLWLAAHRAWIFAGIVLAIDVGVVVFAPDWVVLPVAIAVGLFANDMRRMSLDLHGYAMVHVIAASSFDGALGRLLARRPDLVADACA